MSDKSNDGKGDCLTRAQVSSILKERDAVKEKNVASKNEMMAAMKKELKWWNSAYGTQMVPGSAVGSSKRLKPVKTLAVSNSAVYHNATDYMAETADKSMMYKFLQMGMKSGV